MSSPMDLLTQALGGDALSQLSGALGTDDRTTSKAVSAALPMLMGALAKNASSSNGAGALAGALDRDHDGSVLDDLGGFLGGGQRSAAMGDGILRHVLGGRRPVAETQLSQASGLDSAAAAKLLAMLAPVVMGALGRSKRSSGLDISDLAGMLAGERRRAEAAAPSGMGSMLSQFLDADGDGDVMDDAVRMGGKLLGNLFKK